MRSCWLVPVAALLTAVAAVAADNWTQFRGPNGAGHSDATGLPVKWSEKENVVWKTAIHDKGWSSPVVWGDQIWLTTAKADGTAMYAVCVERGKGTILHDLKLWDVDKPEPLGNPINSYASPTPAIEEGRVYVSFGTYGTVCMDTANGKRIWERRDLHCDHFRGPGSSPILVGDLLILNFDGIDKQYVVALDKKNGDTVWKKDRNIDYKGAIGDLRKGYGTPALITVNGKQQLVNPSAVATIAYDPKNGDELWKVYHGGMNAAAPPLFADGKVFIANGSGALVAVRADGSGDVTKTNLDWTCKKGVPTRMSPLVVEDKLYLVNEGGNLTCLSTKDGSQLWTERLGDTFCSSPIYADGKFYVFSEEGKGIVAEVTKGWKLLAENKLDDGCRASPAVADKALFVRTKTHLYRIEQRD